MKIKSFNAINVYGHMNLRVKFNNDLTFLTGINGSGKTTVVRGISALVTPSLPTLAQMDYERMEVEVQENKKKTRIWASKEKDQFTLGCSRIEETLVVRIIPLDPTEPAYRGREKEMDYYLEIEVRNASHPLLRLLKELPTPMVLGIERRYTEFMPMEDEFTTYRIRRRSFSSSSNPLQLGLAQAASIAEEIYRRVQAHQRELTDKLREGILLSALRYETVGGEIKFQLSEVRNQNIEEKKRLFQSTLQKLGLSAKDIELRLEPFFSKLAELSEILKDEHDLKQIIKGEDARKREAVTEWVINYPQFERINRILSYVETYIEESKKANESVDRYLSITNNFLQDSKKEIKFDETGNLGVSIGGKLAPITSLSSGESQILVIITHLSLNPAAQRANVFIVDEPELSLHIRWQELFVKAVQEASPKLQLILATHSPSIILDRVDKCVDLSEMAL